MPFSIKTWLKTCPSHGFDVNLPPLLCCLIWFNWESSFIWSFLTTATLLNSPEPFHLHLIAVDEMFAEQFPRKFYRLYTTRGILITQALLSLYVITFQVKLCTQKGSKSLVIIRGAWMRRRSDRSLPNSYCVYQPFIEIVVFVWFFLFYLKIKRKKEV